MITITMGGRVRPLLGSLVFFVIAPGTVAGYVRQIRQPAQASEFERSGLMYDVVAGRPPMQISA